MLLVDDNQPWLSQRRKDGRTGPDHDLPPSVTHIPPGIVSLAIRETAVEYRDLIAKLSPESADRLWREGDFGHQDQGALPCAQSVCSGPNVNQCLAASGNAAEQEGLEPAGVDAGTDLGQCLFLGRRRRPGVWRGSGLLPVRVTPYFPGQYTHEPAGSQGAKHGCRDTVRAQGRGGQGPPRLPQLPEARGLFGRLALDGWKLQIHPPRVRGDHLGHALELGLHARVRHLLPDFYQTPTDEGIQGAPRAIDLQAPLDLP